ncbi:MAG: hypothetical protein IPH31_21575, partial [Lewinellaceae bacterium]|nr:hypothetical protein [Lewinellaceae bacterium]
LNLPSTDEEYLTNAYNPEVYLQNPHRSASPILSTGTACVSCQPEASYGTQTRGRGLGGCCIPFSLCSTIKSLISAAIIGARVCTPSAPYGRGMMGAHEKLLACSHRFPALNRTVLISGSLRTSAPGVSDRDGHRLLAGRY